VNLAQYHYLLSVFMLRVVTFVNSSSVSNPEKAQIPFSYRIRSNDIDLCLSFECLGV